MAPEFKSRDPAAADFWSERFAQAFTPWDRGGVPQELQAFAARAARPHATLIPGCGSGYEVACLSEAGWQVTAIDFSAAAVDAARNLLGPWAERVRQADFFDFQPAHPVDLIYERAFFCALPHRMRERVVRRWAELLPPGGLLAGFFFFGDGQKGPPFAIAPQDLHALLDADFELIEDAAVADALPVFGNGERWQVWRRRAAAG